jgi:hypothetical protein
LRSFRSQLLRNRGTEELTRLVFVSILNLSSLPSHLDSLRLIWLWISQDAAEPKLANLEVLGASHLTSQIWKIVNGAQERVFATHVCA